MTPAASDSRLKDGLWMRQTQTPSDAVKPALPQGRHRARRRQGRFAPGVAFGHP